MYQLTALYSHPEDPAAFDKHYREVHSGLGAALPGVKAFTMSWPAPGPDGAKPSYYFVADALLGHRGASARRRSAGPRARPRSPTCPTSRPRASTS